MHTFSIEELEQGAINPFWNGRENAPYAINIHIDGQEFKIKRTSEIKPDGKKHWSWKPWTEKADEKKYYLKIHPASYRDRMKVCSFEIVPFEDNQKGTKKQDTQEKIQEVESDCTSDYEEEEEKLQEAIKDLRISQNDMSPVEEREKDKDKEEESGDKQLYLVMSNESVTSN